ncbi:bifunctional acetate--CoA ligase family protein/GNAT family N-acetyltransferase [Sphingosinithalassobacter sp. CS137]|uniref:bifunctional acetate--CoA ligase family protein/GNAT family N-acetyltransferase n=1 Tax=Sphingosinithalassobacter sp. CS137 TaxID=2762748 RepID=UPI00165DC2E8|nr:bifunctional acetate--CoA ligase family protein/GNAT family N-acetyltransferase [Sphingosinithalassobacter sp. CS137]
MTIHNLDRLLGPRSIAIVGASSRAGTIGQRVLENALDARLDGPVFAVNPNPIELDDDWWVPSIAELPIAPELAVIATPAPTVPDIIAELGAKGTRLAVVISAGLHDPELRQAMLDAAHSHGLRIIGPNCLGVLMPHAGVNASFAQRGAPAGGLALLSQSGALVTSMIDWAAERHVGFSGIVSLGDGADVDFADLIDLFAADARTEAIALYVESIGDAAKFMSAARAASRVKPVIALKAGRTDAAGRAAMSHTGALAGSWDVYQAAFRRAGIVPVETLTGLFGAAQVLARKRPVPGNRLAIVTNGGGAGVLAADALAKTEGALASLSPETVARLDPALPASWSRANPIDVVGDARADRFAAAVDAAAADPAVDALLVMHCPTAVANGVGIADAVLARVSAEDFPRNKPVIGCWLGAGNADHARPRFDAADVPLFDNLDEAVQGFGAMVAARNAREALLRTPAAGAVAAADRDAVQAVIHGARAEGRTTLSAGEAKQLLAALGVPVVQPVFATGAGAVADACGSMRPPYVLKIVSPQLTHKSDVGGVALNLPDSRAATRAAEEMAARIARDHPDAQLLGFEAEPMVDTVGKYELLVGIAADPAFGPVLAVGAGGKAVEVLNDRALGLPPLDAALARDMLARTRIAALLAGYRDVPAADIDGVVRVLQAVSTLVADFPEIAELDINPLLVGSDGVLALDARVGLTAPGTEAKLAIRPVPSEWTADLATRDGTALHVRPVVPADEAVLADFFEHVDAQDLRFRFLTAVRHVRRDQIAAMTQIDYRRAMHFLAFAGETLVASAMLIAESDRSNAELALSVREGWKHKGVSWTLMEHVLRYAEAERIERVESLESSENHAALALEREMGFTAHPCPENPAETLVRKVLRTPAGAA